MFLRKYLFWRVVKKIYDKNFILDELKQRLTLKDRILMHFFKDYTYRIYIKGIKKGYDWDF